MHSREASRSAVATASSTASIPMSARFSCTGRAPCCWRSTSTATTATAAPDASLTKSVIFVAGGRRRRTGDCPADDPSSGAWATRPTKSRSPQGPSDSDRPAQLTSPGFACNDHDRASPGNENEARTRRRLGEGVRRFAHGRRPGAPWHGIVPAASSRPAASSNGRPAGRCPNLRRRCCFGNSDRPSRWTMEFHTSIAASVTSSGRSTSDPETC